MGKVIVKICDPSSEVILEGVTITGNAEFEVEHTDKVKAAKKSGVIRIIGEVTAKSKPNTTTRKPKDKENANTKAGRKPEDSN